jgi:hypothetical protein
MAKDNHNHLSDLEDIVSELQSLSKKQPVKDEDLVRAKELMRSLKQEENGVSPQLNCILEE